MMARHRADETPAAKKRRSLQATFRKMCCCLKATSPAAKLLLGCTVFLLAFSFCVILTHSLLSGRGTQSEVSAEGDENIFADLTDSYHEYTKEGKGGFSLDLIGKGEGGGAEVKEGKEAKSAAPSPPVSSQAAGTEGDGEGQSGSKGEEGARGVEEQSPSSSSSLTSSNSAPRPDSPPAASSNVPLETPQQQKQAPPPPPAKTLDRKDMAETEAEVVLPSNDKDRGDKQKDIQLQSVRSGLFLHDLITSYDKEKTRRYFLSFDERERWEERRRQRDKERQQQQQQAAKGKEKEERQHREGGGEKSRGKGREDSSSFPGGFFFGETRRQTLDRSAEGNWNNHLPVGALEYLGLFGYCSLFVGECFELWRCEGKRSGNVFVYPYKDSLRAQAKEWHGSAGAWGVPLGWEGSEEELYNLMVESFEREVLRPLRESGLFVLVENPEDSCLFIPPLFLPAGTSLVGHRRWITDFLRGLPFWNEGRNHIVHDFTQSPLGSFDADYAIRVRSSWDRRFVRKEFDVSLPMPPSSFVSSIHAFVTGGGGRGPGGDREIPVEFREEAAFELKRFPEPDDRPLVASFKGHAGGVSGSSIREAIRVAFERRGPKFVVELFDEGLKELEREGREGKRERKEGNAVTETRGEGVSKVEGGTNRDGGVSERLLGEHFGGPLPGGTPLWSSGKSGNLTDSSPPSSTSSTQEEEGTVGEGAANGRGEGEGGEKKMDRYVELLLKSKFFLCPPGRGVTTSRFSEALLLGAIPVVVSDQLEPHYEEFADFLAYTVWWPSTRLETLPEFLESIPRPVLDRMHRNGQAVASQVLTAPPVLTAMKILKRRLQRMGEVHKGLGEEFEITAQAAATARSSSSSSSSSSSHPPPQPPEGEGERERGGLPAPAGTSPQPSSASSVKVLNRNILWSMEMAQSRQASAGAAATVVVNHPQAADVSSPSPSPPSGPTPPPSLSGAPEGNPKGEQTAEEMGQGEPQESSSVVGGGLNAADTSHSLPVSSDLPLSESKTEQNAEKGIYWSPPVEAREKEENKDGAKVTPGEQPATVTITVSAPGKHRSPGAELSAEGSAGPGPSPAPIVSQTETKDQPVAGVAAGVSSSQLLEEPAGEGTKEAKDGGLQSDPSGSAAAAASGINPTVAVSPFAASPVGKEASAQGPGLVSSIDFSSRHSDQVPKEQTAGMVSGAG
uniref:Exostosin GT47 domain-containing protein n=1 Tax=Chromera velia CCMP2878 TaxID=1169474 RepID=A0A0G4FJ75_9ALVE|eukprot:Cvel_17328.t1-p1 / transcript=Cvel_17328.t1 / gene=Cvel_17328 / organism=Chromera_velia_CCMP2878 / gene_product=Probable glycosyltransferase At3g42180, putative / transcript_product=Probable glycosyltransferase At3g42180, putative / location=Cvel_scaffold1376:33565-46105(-) / protein_length=1183 / sequence_SO=supercontig / SO=protein_coding / is_pseudo=false